MAGQPATDVDVRIGARIRDARRRANLTQRAVGRALGMSAAQLQKYEKGTNRISAVGLSIVAELTGTPIAAFFDAPGPAAGERPATAAQALRDLGTAARAFVEAEQSEARERNDAATGRSTLTVIGEAA